MAIWVTTKILACEIFSQDGIVKKGALYQGVVASICRHYNIKKIPNFLFTPY